jgi:ABC-type multidrug transport system fused ATPase/permease subunit
MSDLPQPAALLPVANGREIRGYFRRAGAGRWPWVLVTLLALVAESALGLLPPIAVGWLTQAVVDHRGTSAVTGPIVLLVAGAVAGTVMAYLAGVLLARTVLPPVAHLREDVLTTALTLPIDQVEAGGIGDLVARVSGDVETVADAAEEALGEFIGAALTILSTLIGLAAVDWRLALAGLLAVPIQIHTLRWYLRSSQPIYAAGRVAEGRRAAALLAVFASLPTLRAFRLGPRHRRQVETGSTDAMNFEFAATRVATRFFGRLNSAEFVGLGAILVVAYVLVRHGQLSVGAAATAALFFAALFDPINTVLGVFDSIQQAAAGLGRLIGITMAKPAAGSRSAGSAPYVLAARGLTFGYGDGPDVLRDVDVVLEPGRHVAVVGTTGSGKTTLATLLAGIRHPRRGSVSLSETELPDIDPTQLHRTVALVTQEHHVFAGTITDNLALARPGLAADQARELMAEVGADAWVNALDDGVDTEVGAGGQVLTAGQAQQLALARLLLLDPPIVLLDEATAEAGSDVARQLDDAAERVIEGRTALVIAHRLSQARTADLVLVMSEGRVTERGTHDELLATGGEYARLWAAWADRGSARSG